MQGSQSELIGDPIGFAITQRIPRKEGFNHVLRAKRVTGLYFSVFFAENSKGCARLGIVASKKVLPAAVDRNHVKRMIREAFRRHKISARNLDLVVMVKDARIIEVGDYNKELVVLFNRVDDKCAGY